jgi:hypothetical protein
VLHDQSRKCDLALLVADACVLVVVRDLGQNLLQLLNLRQGLVELLLVHSGAFLLMSGVKTDCDVFQQLDD